MQKVPYTNSLFDKLEALRELRRPVQLGRVSFSSPLLLAPMSAICTAPYRTLMEELGAGGTVSELISCHGINYQNQKTLEMLKLGPNENNVGLQLFGEDPQKMAQAAKIAESYGPKFIDINMGCPVRKVVTKGGGSALLRDVQNLSPFLKAIKSELTIPLTIKIRMGWDSDQINADEIIQMAKSEHIEFVAIHGRTRAQQYKGIANWDYIEKLAQNSPLPLIGNGDLHSAQCVNERLQKSHCHALMLGRGALRNPFIFLESLDPLKVTFTAGDYLEVLHRYLDLLNELCPNPRARFIQWQKMIGWSAAGFSHTSKFRSLLYQCYDIDSLKACTQEYFLSIKTESKYLDHSKTFMAGGHG